MNARRYEEIGFVQGQCLYSNFAGAKKREAKIREAENSLQRTTSGCYALVAGRKPVPGSSEPKNMVFRCCLLLPRDLNHKQS